MQSISPPPLTSGHLQLGLPLASPLHWNIGCTRCLRHAADSRADKGVAAGHIGKHWIICLRSFFTFSFAQEIFLQDARQLLHEHRMFEEFSACPEAS